MSADVHDHLDNLRRRFNDRQCECVLSGDLVSTFAVPPLRQLGCPFYGCRRQRESTGLLAGMRIIGELRDAAAVRTARHDPCGAVHMERQFRGFDQPFDIGICGHTHKPSIWHDEHGHLWINPGETSGWTFGNPTVALLDTVSRTAEIVPLVGSRGEG
ncbi:MAG: metallophosphoesterase family protein [Planctomycetaceae bacterium]